MAYPETYNYFAGQVIAGYGFAVGSGEPTSAYTPTVVADSSGNLYQAGTQVTATAAKLNVLAANTATGAELSLMHSGAVTNTRRQLQTIVVPLAAATATTGGAVASFLNPEGNGLIVWNAVVFSVAPSTDAAAALDIGIGASATTAYTNIFTADACLAAATTFYGSNASTPVTFAAPILWAPSSYLTASLHSASHPSTGSTANLYLTYCVQ